MLRWLTAVGAAMTMAFPAEGQECRATLQSQPPAWSALQTREQPDTAQMKLFIETTCRNCDPMIVVEVFAGAASVSFRSLPIAQKTGTEFAEAVVSDPRERSDFLDTTLATERLSSPSCVMDGRIDGVSRIGPMGMIVANLRAQCDHTPEPFVDRCVHGTLPIGARRLDRNAARRGAPRSPAAKHSVCCVPSSSKSRADALRRPSNVSGAQ